MTAVTVVEVAGLEVDDADKHGDEDGILVISGHRVVQLGGDDLRGEALFGDGTEQVDSDGHGERSGDALAADVTDAETKAVTLEEEVVEVAAHFLGGHDGSVKVDIATVRECREGAGHHRHLDITCDTQFAVDTLLGSGRVSQLVVGLAQFPHLLAAAEVVEDEEGESDEDDGYSSLYLQVQLGEAQVFCLVFRPCHINLCSILVGHLLHLGGVGRVAIFLVTQLVEIGLPVVAEASIGLGCELQTVDAATHIGGDVQGLGIAAVLHGVVEVNDGAKIVVVAVFALQFLALSVGTVEVIATILIVGVCDADIGPCRQPMLHDDVGLGQCLAGAVEHLLGFMQIDVDFRHPEVRGGGTLVREEAVLVVDGLIELVLGLGEVSQARRHGGQSVRGRVKSELTVMLVGIVVNLVGQLQTARAVHIVEAVDGLIRPCLVEQPLLTGSGLAARLYQLVGDEHETIDSVRAVVAVHLLLQLRDAVVAARRIAAGPRCLRRCNQRRHDESQCDEYVSLHFFTTMATDQWVRLNGV